MAVGTRTQVIGAMSQDTTRRFIYLFRSAFTSRPKMEQDSKRIEKLPLHAEDEERIARLSIGIKRDTFFFAFALVWFAAWIVVLLCAIFV